MAVRTGIEPVISSVTGRHVNRYTNAPAGADEGNRTLVSTLARSRSTIELHLQNGVLEPIRTADRPLRRRMLYPLSYEDSIIMLTCWQVFDKYKNAILIKFLRKCCENEESLLMLGGHPYISAQTQIAFVASP